METTATTPREQRRFVYVGTVELEAKKKSESVGVELREVLDGNQLSEPRYFARKNFKSMTIGGIYRIDVEDGGRTVYSSSRVYVGIFPDDDKVMEWQTLERAKEIEKQARSKEARDRQPLALELLAPLRKAYQRTNPVGRLAIEVQVLAYLRSQRVVTED